MQKSIAALCTLILSFTFFVTMLTISVVRPAAEPPVHITTPTVGTQPTLNATKAASTQMPSPTSTARSGSGKTATATPTATPVAVPTVGPTEVPTLAPTPIDLPTATPTRPPL